MKPLIKFKTLQNIALVVSLALSASAQAGEATPPVAEGQSKDAGPSYPISNQPPPGTLWYNGDLNVSPFGIGLSNEIAFGYGWGPVPAQIYDDFNVTWPFGWNVTAVFSDNLVDTLDGNPIVGAAWEIRQGISAGNPGVLIASGFTLTPSVTETGRGCPFGYYCSAGGTELRVMVTGLNLFLSPGQYWLNVTPIGNSNTDSNSQNSVTIGADCVGTPCGNNGNAFINSASNVWDPTTNYGSEYGDFAMGMVGNFVNGSPQLFEGGSIKQGFKIMLPINGESGIEDRSGQPGGTYTITMTFNENIASVARASASCGKVESTSIDGATLTINLTKVSGSCNASHITVTANDVKDSAGVNLGTACITVGLLLGDVNGDGVVDSADIDIVNSQIGQTTNEENFRSDINNDGVISGPDLRIVTQHQGTYLP
jgi:hypothetical protein